MSCTIPPLPRTGWRRRIDLLEDRPVYLYAVRRAASDEIKIGISDNPLKRLRELQIAHGVPLDLALAVPCTIAFEREIHARFAAHRLMGEWFTEVAEITEWIDSENAKVPAAEG